MIVGGGIFFVVLQHELVCFSSLDIVLRTAGRTDRDQLTASHFF